MSREVVKVINIIICLLLFILTRFILATHGLLVGGGAGCKVTDNFTPSPLVEGLSTKLRESAK